MGAATRRIAAFGALFDPDPEPGRLAKKVQTVRSAGPLPEDPYSVLAEALGADITLGHLPVESWVSAFPDPADLHWLRTENLTRFIAEGGCELMAGRLESWASSRLGDSIPAMIGVDHSLTAGMVRALRKRYGEDLAVLVVDAHVDAIPQGIRDDLAMYAFETGRAPKPPGWQAFPNRDVFHCGTFLHALVEEGTVPRGQVAVIGNVEARPLARSHDERAAGYLDFCDRWLDANLVQVSQTALLSSASMDGLLLERLGHLLSEDRPVYLSWDMDVGALSALHGVRFLDQKGLDGRVIRRLLRALRKAFQVSGARLVGFDVMEFDSLTAGDDSTYAIAREVLRTLVRIEHGDDPGRG
ncbi:MAG: hypothetical protein GEU93_18480 [Propionibacteriales bacterium]|nr:hypothetical protein [Propionibacteriales bacterium]